MPHTIAEPTAQLDVPALIADVVAAYQATNPGADNITAVRLLLARGETFQVAYSKSKGVSDNLHDILAIFDEIAQRIAKGQSLKPLIALAEQVKAERVEGKPRTWTMRLHNADTHTETCTKWCTSSHRGDIESAGGNREDIWHRTDTDGVELPVSVNMYETADMTVLTGSITVSPYSQDARRRAPRAAVEILEGEWVEHLDPDGLQDVIDKVRLQADRLQQMHAQLVQARAEWTGGQA